jgi:hypothetical protein
MADEMMTEEQAKEVAYQMHRQKISYNRIEEHLSNKFVSKKTGKPVKAITIRHWVSERLKEEQEDAAMQLTSPSLEFMNGLREVCSMENLSPDTQKRMVLSFIQAMESAQS